MRSMRAIPYVPKQWNFDLKNLENLSASSANSSDCLPLRNYCLFHVSKRTITKGKPHHGNDKPEDIFPWMTVHGNQDFGAAQYLQPKAQTLASSSAMNRQVNIRLTIPRAFCAFSKSPLTISPFSHLWSQT